jgi:adenosylcobinamide-phosphate synthase
MTGAAAVALLPVAVILDMTFGEPPSAIHPVVWMGHAVKLCERRAPARGKLGPFAAGVAMAIAVPALFAAAAWLAQSRLREHPVIAWVFGAAVLKTTFALRALRDAAERVRDAVARGALDEARAGLRSLCSRDPSTLDGAALVAAAIESLAENASDSFVAPLFWFALFGLPGAVFYRAVNTLDAMVGYRGKYEWLGKASARFDDALNWVPARLTAGLLIAAAWLQRRDAARGLRVLARDGAKTPSPNAGRPMAAMAGILGLELAKEGHYRLGDATEPLVPAKVDEAWCVVRLAAIGAVAAMSAVVGARLAAFG